MAVGTTVVAIALSCTSVVPSHASAAAVGRLTIEAQGFDIEPGQSLAVTFELPPGLDTSSFASGTVLRLTAHERIADREAFLNALDGSLGDVDSSLTLPLDPAGIDATMVTYPSTTTVTLTVPTLTSLQAVDDGGDERTTGEPVATNPLMFNRPGVHAVQIDLISSGHSLADTTTFVRVVDPAEDPDDMSVAIVMGQTSDPGIGRDGSIELTADNVDEMTRLADTLDGLDGVPVAVGTPERRIPRAVFVEPSTLQALAVDDPELAARLSRGLTSSVIIPGPIVPFEPSAAAASGQADRYTRLLSSGEDLLDQLLPGTEISRTVQIVREPFTTAAAELQRKNVGARLMVMGFDLYSRTTGGNGAFTDTSQLVTIALDDQTEALTSLVDPHIGTRLEEGTDAPMATAIATVADLAVTAQSIADDGGLVSRHGMVLATSGLDVPDAELMADLAALVSTTRGLRLVEPSTLASTVDVLLRPGGGGEVRVTMPTQPYVDLDDRTALIDAISTEILSYASMLPVDAPEVRQWLNVLEALPSTAIDDADADAMVAGIRDSFGAYRNAVVGPSPFTFTFTSRNNTLTFSLTNTTDVPLKVRVALTSPKLVFPDGDRIVELAPNADTELDFAAQALSNGRSSVFLRVYTPAENSTVQLIPEVVLTAQVRSLAGLGQLITGAFLLLLLAWWGRHWQQTRRRRLAAGNLDRHPASARRHRRRAAAEPDGSETSQDDTTPVPPARDGAADEASVPPDGDLAPDAAASSLPPS